MQAVLAASSRVAGLFAETPTVKDGTETITGFHDRIALHRVRPCEGRTAVSLHLYSRPIDVCQVYDEDTGDVLAKQLIYHSAAS